MKTYSKLISSLVLTTTLFIEVGAVKEIKKQTLPKRSALTQIKDPYKSFGIGFLRNLHSKIDESSNPVAEYLRLGFHLKKLTSQLEPKLQKSVKKEYSKLKEAMKTGNFTKIKNIIGKNLFNQLQRHSKKSTQIIEQKFEQILTQLAKDAIEGNQSAQKILISFEIQEDTLGTIKQQSAKFSGMLKIKFEQASKKINSNFQAFIIKLTNTTSTQKLYPHLLRLLETIQKQILILQQCTTEDELDNLLQSLSIS